MKLKLVFLAGAVTLFLAPTAPASAIVCIDPATICCGTILGKEVLPITC